MKRERHADGAENMMNAIGEKKKKLIAEKANDQKCGDKLSELKRY